MNGMPMEEDIDDEFNDEEPQVLSSAVINGESVSGESAAAAPVPDIPELSRKDKTLDEVLQLMDGEFAPIIPDAVTDYYLAKNGFETSDVRIKRLLALATQKFVNDIAQDAYEYSRIRNSSAVYNSANPQVRAKQLLQGQQFANQQSVTGGASNVSNVETGEDGQASQPQQSQPSHSGSSAGNQQGKIVLTMEDLSNALSEYGMNTARPDFYR